MYTFLVICKNKKYKLKAKDLASAEAKIIKLLTDDGDSALLWHDGGENISTITKDSTAKHWTHDGYKFSQTKR
jgi:hypothetical protein